MGGDQVTNAVRDDASFAGTSTRQNQQWAVDMRDGILLGGGARVKCRVVVQPFVPRLSPSRKLRAIFLLGAAPMNCWMSCSQTLGMTLAVRAMSDHVVTTLRSILPSATANTDDRADKLQSLVSQSRALTARAAVTFQPELQPAAFHIALWLNAFGPAKPSAMAVDRSTALQRPLT